MLTTLVGLQAERALAEIIVLLFPLFFINVLYYLIVAMLMIPLMHLRRENSHKPGVIRDILHRWGCTCAGDSPAELILQALCCGSLA